MGSKKDSPASRSANPTTHADEADYEWKVGSKTTNGVFHDQATSLTFQAVHVRAAPELLRRLTLVAVTLLGQRVNNFIL
jgi:hypothetical protein